MCNTLVQYVSAVTVHCQHRAKLEVYTANCYNDVEHMSSAECNYKAPTRQFKPSTKAEHNMQLLANSLHCNSHNALLSTDW